MKLIPDAISRQIASRGLLASENAPKVLFVSGVVGMVGSTVLACRATLQLEDVLRQIQSDQAATVDAKELVDSDGYDGDATYPDSEFRRDRTIILVRGVGNVAKLYAPAVLLGAASIAALTKSHNILQERNLALTAAYAAIDTAFARYRDRVVERFGAEVDQELRYEIEQVDEVDEATGKVKARNVITDAPGSAYARFYDEVSSINWSPDPDINLLFLRQIQNHMNDKLKARGHVFLNEVFTELGLSHTTAGAIVGWRWNKESGDDYIDFGIWDGSKEDFNEFFNGRPGAILLDFNVDGPIYDKIEN